MGPTPEEVRQQLDRILASDAFAGAERASRFLRYVVERTLLGEGDRLKEFAVGTDVFDRGDDYDPRIDSIVRVEAGRLRARLEQYYQRLDCGDSVFIQMRRGSYVPVFERRAVALPLPPRDNWFTPRLAWAVLAVSVAVALGAWRATVLPRAGASPRVVVAVLPFAHFSTDPGDQLLAARVTDGVTSELVHMDGVSVVARRNALHFAASGRPVQEAVRALDADVVVEASLLVENERIQVDLRLVNVEAGRKTWGQRFTANLDDVPDLQRRVAASVAEAAAKARRP